MPVREGIDLLPHLRIGKALVCRGFFVANLLFLLFVSCYVLIFRRCGKLGHGGIRIYSTIFYSDIFDIMRP